MHYVYILYSAAYDKYYVGETSDPNRRLLEHNELSENSYTSRYRPWSIVLLLAVADRSLARKMERYIKSQKSKRYLRDLINSKERQSNLRGRFE